MIYRKLLGLIICSFLLSCGSNISEKDKKKEKIESLLSGIEHSASPRLSIKYCKEIIEIDPKNREAHYKLAEAYRDMANIVVKSENEIKRYRALSKKNFSVAKYLEDQQNVQKKGK